MTKLERFLTLGLYFGYPNCCIIDFMSRGAYPDVDRKLKGTGFVPCAVCDLKSEEDILEDIYRNRVCPVPFPDGDDAGFDYIERIIANANR